jgi:hypothetical protein
MGLHHWLCGWQRLGRASFNGNDVTALTVNLKF